LEGLGEEDKREKVMARERKKKKSEEKSIS
jgi:hypothetical protein